MPYTPNFLSELQPTVICKKVLITEAQTLYGEACLSPKGGGEYVMKGRNLKRYWGKRN